ncbi:MAG: Uma2 family endonuclease [Bacteroidota bacterium]
MSTIVEEVVEEIATTRPRHVLWTVEQYLRMIDEGLLTEDDKTELLNGNLVRKIPSNKPHDSAISFLQDYFTERYFKKYTLRSERAIRLSPDSMPEPDYVIAVYREDKYQKVWPSVPDILLLVEVSDATLATDRGYKKQLHAGAGIEEYWIVNIPDQQIEVHLRPNVNTKHYASTQHYGQPDTFTSPFVGEVKVSDLLPLA